MSRGRPTSAAAAVPPGEGDAPPAELRQARLRPRVLVPPWAPRHASQDMASGEGVETGRIDRASGQGIRTGHQDISGEGIRTSLNRAPGRGIRTGHQDISGEGIMTSSKRASEHLRRRSQEMLGQGVRTSQDRAPGRAKTKAKHQAKKRQAAPMTTQGRFL